MPQIVNWVVSLFAWLMVANSAFGAGITNADLVGTYRVEMTTRQHESVLTNFLAFAITLKVDGSFAATNVPPDLFFDYTPTAASPEARGTWQLRHESDGGSLFYTGETDYLILDFTVPSPGTYETLLGANRTTLGIKINYHTGKKDAAVFFLTKQK